MSSTTTEETIAPSTVIPLQMASEELTEEELEALEDAEDLAVAKERYASMDRSQLVCSQDEFVSCPS